MHIDLARTSDIPALCGLLDQLFSQEAEFISDRTVQTRGLEMILANPEIGTILVARRDNAVVGVVNLLYSISTALGARVATLEDMVIASPERGKGLGSQLLSAAIELCREQGCGRITLLTDSNNLDAQRFYQRQGFTLSPMVPLRLVLK